MAMSTVFKKSVLKSPNSSAKSSPFAPANQNFSAVSSALDHCFSRSQPDCVEEEEEGLPDHTFRQMMYNAFTRKHILGCDSNSVSTPASPSVQTPSLSVFAKSQGRKMNGFSNLSNFIGRKQEQEQMDCI
jgi:hypothetical protein